MPATSQTRGLGYRIMVLAERAPRLRGARRHESTTRRVETSRTSFDPLRSSSILFNPLRCFHSKGQRQQKSLADWL
ncbi:hypothetical protein S40293_11498 [Stachybotrys chartarum IBT 40293]|nr:hypothetical protein S40293_11498 [Stachybotrys chartarum IBT 40293]